MAMLALVAGGNDPSAEYAAARIEPTVDELWPRCEMKHYVPGKTWNDEAKRLYENHIKPRIGRERVSTIRYADVAGVHEALRNRPVQANRVLAVMSKMFKIAEQMEWRTPHSNPCHAVQRFPEHRRGRFAKPAEIRAIGPLLDAEAANDPAGVAFLYLMMFSGARPSEIANATWPQLERLDNGAGVLRIAEGKTGRRDVYLPLQAMAVLDRLPKDTATITGRKLPRKLWGRIRKAAGCPDLWARDLRRTFATVGMSGGLKADAIGELLGHKSAQTTKIYAKLMEEPAVAASAMIATRIEELLKPTSTA